MVLTIAKGDRPALDDGGYSYGESAYRSINPGNRSPLAVAAEKISNYLDAAAKAGVPSQTFRPELPLIEGLLQLRLGIKVKGELSTDSSSLQPSAAIPGEGVINLLCSHAEAMNSFDSLNDPPMYRALAGLLSSMHARIYHGHLSGRQHIQMSKY